MSPILRHGYRSEADKADLRNFYASAGWKAARAQVLSRASGLCEFCGDPPDGRQGFDVVHLVGSTLDLIRADGNAVDPSQLAARHRGCHAAFSSGRIPRPG
jgi:hypothetical protein